MKKRIICSILALSISIGGFAYAEPNAGGSDVAELKQQLEENNRKREELNSELSQLESQLTEATNKLIDAQFELDRLNSDIAVTKSELETAEKKFNERSTALNSRVEAMYKSGNVGYVEVVLSSESIGDFFTRLDMVRNVVNHDNEVIKGLKEESDRIESKKAELEEKQVQAEEAKKVSEEKKNELVEIAQAKESLVANLDSDNQRINTEINRIQEEARRAEEARREEEASRNNNRTEASNNNSSGTSGTQSPAPAPAPSEGRASQALSIAYQQLGVPYVWGGTSPSGFDCSGLTSYVYSKVGVSLPRIASAQQNFGTQVSVSDLQPGDLVFFNRPATHVGIYVGNGNYLHAPRTGRNVSIDSLSYRRPTSATRVL